MNRGSSSATSTDLRVHADLQELIAEVRALREDVGSAVELLRDSSERRDDAVDDATNNPERMLTASEFAAILQVHPRTLRTMSQSGEVPKPVMIGRSPRWSRRTIERFIEERQR